MTPVEKVARAMHPQAFELGYSTQMNFAREKAAAAIRALMEPSEHMLTACEHHMRTVSPEERMKVALAGTSDAHRYKMRGRWKAMLTAALEEKP